MIYRTMRSSALQHQREPHAVLQLLLASTISTIMVGRGDVP